MRVSGANWKTFALCTVLFAVASCDGAEYWSYGDYVVYEIDWTGAELGYRLEGGGTIRRIPPEIVEVGANDDYVVAQVRNEETGTDGYYYIDVSLDHPFHNEEDITIAPISEAVFLSEKTGFPDFDPRFSTGLWARWF